MQKIGRSSSTLYYQYIRFWPLRNPRISKYALPNLEVRTDIEAFKQANDLAAKRRRKFF